MIPEIPEFSRPIRIDQISTGGVARDLVATADECRALAERFDVPAVQSLSARVRVTALRGGAFYLLNGHLSADLSRICVTTLDPFTEHVDEEFEMTFAVGGGEGDLDDSEVELAFEDDMPEPIINGTIDIGEAVAEHLALAMDPFPRKPGASIPADLTVPPEDEVKPNPFAVLGQLRQKKG